MSAKRKVRGFKQSELVLPESDVLPFKEEALEPSRSTVMTPRTTTVRNLHAYARDEWAPKPLRGWLALRQSAGWFGIGRTWVPYWCAFDSRYLLLYVHQPGTQESHKATGYSVTSLDPSQARSTITVAPQGITTTEIPIPAMMIDLSRSTVEAKFEDGQLYAFVHRPDFPDYVMCGNHIKYWIHEWQKINTTWTDESGAMLDVPTDVVDKAGNVMEPRMDMSERFFLRQQGAFLLYMAGPLQFEAWNSRLGDKWFLHFCTFDAYDPVPKLCIFGDGKDVEDRSPPKIVELADAIISEHLDSRQRAKMKIELPGRPPIVCDGPNIQWWLGALQWATSDKSRGKAMFRDLIVHRRFVPVEKSISVLRMQRRATSTQLSRNRELKRPTLVDVPESDANGFVLKPMSSKDLQKVKTGDWKSKSGSHATSNIIDSNGSNRLSAAEFARQVGQSPPRKGRRSSAPKPNQAQMNRTDSKKLQTPVESRAQIPLISLSIPTDTDGNQATSSNADAPMVSPRYKSSKPTKNKSPSVHTDSPLSNSLPPGEEDEAPLAKSPGKGRALLSADSPAEPSKSPRKVKGVFISEDDIAVSPRSPRFRSTLNKEEEEDGPKSPRSPRTTKSPSSPTDDDDIPDEVLGNSKPNTSPKALSQLEESA
jgi:hypothetical protein